MKQQPDGTYLSFDRPIAGFVVGAFFAFVFAVGTWRAYIAHGVDVWTILPVLAFAGDILLCMSLPTMYILFDPERKIVTWRSSSLMNRRGGQFPFDAVRGVVLQSASDSGGVSYRVAIVTSRDTIPITAGYGNTKTMAERQATNIRDILGMRPPSVPDDSIAAAMGITDAQ